MFERRGLLAGAATLGVLLPGGAPAEAIPTKYNHAPELAAQAIRHNAVLIPELGCSGWLLRDQKGEIDGVLFADHCNVTEERSLRVDTSKGDRFIVQEKPVLVERGRNDGRMHTVGLIDKYILPGTIDYKDNTHDVAIGVLKGHTPAEPYRDYERTVLPADQVEVGDTLFAGAFPLLQPQNHSGHSRRQTLKLKVTDQGHGKIGNYKGGIEKNYVHFINGTVYASEDGAECSPRSSGSGFFELVNGHVRIAGVETLGYDHTGSDGVYDPNEQRQHPDYAAATCSIADELAAPKELSGKGYSDGSIVKAVSSTAEIPGYMSYSEMSDKLVEAFRDPNVPKTALEGRIALLSQKGGGPDSPAYSTLIDRPVLFHFEVPDTTFIVWSLPNPKDPGNLVYTSLDRQHLNQALIVGETPGDKPKIDMIEGALTNSSTDNQPDFVDGQGRHFGRQTSDTLPTNGYEYHYLRSTKHGLKLASASKGIYK